MKISKIALSVCIEFRASPARREKVSKHRESQPPGRMFPRLKRLGNEESTSSSAQESVRLKGGGAGDLPCSAVSDGVKCRGCHKSRKCCRKARPSACDCAFCSSPAGPIERGQEEQPKKRGSGRVPARSNEDPHIVDHKRRKLTFDTNAQRD